LLREGLDLPEVTLVAILDADREGFLRSRVSLIQTMGRAARNIKGEVILYADKVTDSMAAAISEIKRRRQYQVKFNTDHNIKPTSISKPFRERIIDGSESNAIWDNLDKVDTKQSLDLDVKSLTPRDHAKWVKRLERDMKKAASEMQFELAILIRDKLRELKGNSSGRIIIRARAKNISPLHKCICNNL